MTRACGIEGRSPLFDQRVVELSLTIPPEFKLSGATEKAVLKAAVQDLLPAAIIARPKSGMMVPVQYWFRQLWPKQARALLLSKHAKIRPYLNQELIREWLDYRGDTWGRYGVKLWLLVSLELWLQEQGLVRYEERSRLGEHCTWGNDQVATSPRTVPPSQPKLSTE